MSEKITTDKQDTRLSLEQHIARALKRKRISQGYKISDVARIAELSQGMISKVENAQVSTSLDTLSRLCNAIDLPISKLFSDFDRICRKDKEKFLIFSAYARNDRCRFWLICCIFSI